MLTLQQFKGAFSERTWNKGRYLHQNDYVDALTHDDQKEKISGEVFSESGYGSYDVIVRWKGGRIHALCSCPVSLHCKHAAALCQAAIEQDSGIWPADNREVSTWLKSLESGNRNEKKAKTEKLVFILSDKQVGDDEGVAVTLKSTRILKSGQLSKSLRNQHLSDYLMHADFMTEEDRYLCADIMSQKNAFNLIQDFHILEKIITSGKAYWLDFSSQPLSLGQALTTRLDWLQLENDLTTLRPILEDEALRLLPTSPISYLDEKQQRLGTIDFGISPEKARSLLATPLMSQEQLSWAYPQLQALLGTEAEALPEPSIQNQQDLIEPTPQLHFFSLEYDPETSKAVLQFNYQGQIINPHHPDALFTSKQGHSTFRHLAFEKAAIAKLHDAGFKTDATYNNSYWSLPDYTLRLHKNAWYPMLHSLVPALQQQGWQVSFDNDFHYQLLDGGSLIEADFEEQGNDFFSLGMNINIDGQQVPLFPILHSAIQQLPKDVLTSEHVTEHEFIYVDMGEGKGLPMALGTIKPLLNQFVELFMANPLDKDGRLKLSRYQSHSTLDTLDNQGIISAGEQALRKVAEKLKDFDGIRPIASPPALKAELRPYQIEGLSWMQFLREYQLAGILADDMGLGKTLQTLANLCVEKQSGRLNQPALIIAPTSVIFNWASEVEKFCPHLTHLVIHGNKRTPLLDSLSQYDLVITSYALLPRDIDAYKAQPFHYLVLDEAQYIKNPKTRLYGAVTEIQANHRLCLTGTPMENHVGELWSQFNFLLPGFLGNQQQFSKLFKTPIAKNDGARKALLNQKIKPFLLRRTKDKIARELPAKTEIVQTVKIEGKQAELYESVRLAMDEKLRDIIATKGLKRSQIEILDAMLKLRQVCCHPQLLSLPSARKVQQSAKMDLLMEMLPELIEEGRRILLFSQFTSMLELIEQALNKAGIAYVKLTGATRDRQKVLQQFKQGEVPLFLISLKAGGTGLNLTEADTVIHYDPWWNPAVENQATDRAHRIGQDKPVFVYKFLVEGSIEEKIQALQQQKSRLADAILSDTAVDGAVSLDQGTLQSLLQPLSG